MVSVISLHSMTPATIADYVCFEHLSMNKMGFFCRLSEEEEFNACEMHVFVTATWEHREMEEEVKGQVSATEFNQKYRMLCPPKSCFRHSLIAPFPISSRSPFSKVHQYSSCMSISMLISRIFYFTVLQSIFSMLSEIVLLSKCILNIFVIAPLENLNLKLPFRMLQLKSLQLT